jgi:hypothetical protein
MRAHGRGSGRAKPREVSKAKLAETLSDHLRNQELTPAEEQFHHCRLDV